MPHRLSTALPFLLLALWAPPTPAAVGLEALLAEGDDASVVEGRLKSIEAALLLYQSNTGAYPPASTGLLALIGEGLIHADDLLDPWKQPLRYELTNDGADYRVTSIGPDRVQGTADDRWVDGSGELGMPTSSEAAPPADSAPPLGLGSVPPAKEIVSLALTEDSQGIAYVAQREDGFWAGWGHGESGPFDRLQLVECGSVRGACVFAGARGGVLHLITPTETRARPNLTGAGFVRGTTDLFLIERENGVSRGTIAGRELAFGTSLAPGQASMPTFDSDDRPVAWRERLEDGRYVVHIGPQASEPAEWASAPVVLPLASGDRVAFRAWDGERTMAVVGSDGFDVAWARDPIVSRDGAAWGMAVCLDGQPASDFEVAREQQCVEQGRDGFSTTPAFVTTRANLIVNGKTAGADSAWSGEPIFAPDASRWAYRARDHEGQWHIHRATAGAVAIGPRFDEVARPRFVLDGRHVLHSARRDGVDMLVCDGKMTAAPWGVRVQTGADGHAWVCDDAGQRILVAASSDFDDIASIARADEIDLEGFLPGTTRPFARLRDGETWRLWIDGVSTEPCARVLPTAAAETAIGYALEVGGEYLAAVYHVASKAQRTIKPDVARAGFDAVGEPHVGETGAIAFEVAADAYVFTLLPDDYPTPTGGGSRLLVFQDGTWSQGPVADDIDSILAGSDGRFVYRANGPAGQRVDQFVGGVFQEGVWYAAVEQLELRADGSPVYIARRDNGRECVVLGTRQSPAMGTIEGFELGPDAMTPVWITRSEGRPRVVLDGILVDIDAEPLGAWLWSPGGRHLIYRALHVQRATSAETELLVIANRDARARPLTVGGDAVSAPRLIEDGATVELVVARDGVPKAITIPLE